MEHFAEILVIFTGIFLLVQDYFKKCYSYWNNKGLLQLERNVFQRDLRQFFDRKYSKGLYFKHIYQDFKDNGFKHGGAYHLSKPVYVPVDSEFIGNILGNSDYFTSDFEEMNAKQKTSKKIDIPKIDAKLLSTVNLYISKIQDVDKHVREEVKMLVYYAIYEILNKNEVLKKMKQEICGYSDAADMVFMEKIIQEIFRLYPLTPTLTKVCKKDFRIPGTSVVLEKGTPIVIPVLGIHYDSDYYTDPSRFDPKRFEQEQVSIRRINTFFDGSQNSKDLIKNIKEVLIYVFK